MEIPEVAKTTENDLIIYEFNGLVKLCMNYLWH